MTPTQPTFTLPLDADEVRAEEPPTTSEEIPRHDCDKVRRLHGESRHDAGAPHPHVHHRAPATRATRALTLLMESHPCVADAQRWALLKRLASRIRAGQAEGAQGGEEEGEAGEAVARSAAAG